MSGAPKLPATYVEGFTNAIELAAGQMRAHARRIVHAARYAPVAQQRSAKLIADAFLKEADALAPVLLPPHVDDRATMARERAEGGAA